MSRGDGNRYRALMAKAATGDRKAARALIIGEWLTGDPDDPRIIDRAIRGAEQSARMQRALQHAAQWEKNATPEQRAELERDRATARRMLGG